MTLVTDRTPRPVHRSLPADCEVPHVDHHPAPDRPVAAGPSCSTGTPVVPGVALGPVVRPSGAVRLPDRGPSPRSPEERPGRGEGAVPAAAAEAVAERLSGAGRRPPPASVPRCWPTTAGLARDRGLLRCGRAAHRRRRAGRASPRWQAAQQFVDLFTSLGGLMAERVTDVRDVRDRIVAELTGQGEPGVPIPDGAVGAAGRRPRPGRHRRPGPGAHHRPGHPAGRHDQPHRDHRPPARDCPASSPSAGSTTSAPGARCSSTASRARSPSIPTRPTPPRAWPRHGPRRRDRWPATPGPARPRDGHAVAVLANVQDGAGARAAAAAHAEGVGPVPHRAGLPRTRDRSRRSRSRPQIYAEVFEAFAGRKVVLRTLDAGSDKPLAFATPARRGQPGAGRARAADRRGATRACWTGSWTPSPQRPRADRLDAVGDGADGGHRRRGGATSPRRCAPAGSCPGVMIEVPVGGAARRPAARARRLPVDRHQRPVAVHARGRPAVGRPRRPHRPVAAGAAAPRAAHRRGRAADGQAGRRLRRGRRRSAAGLRARRARDHVAVLRRVRGRRRRGPPGDRRPRDLPAGRRGGPGARRTRTALARRPVRC